MGIKIQLNSGVLADYVLFHLYQDERANDLV